MKQILVINGHPHKDSFNHALAQQYIKGVKSTNAKFTQINLGDLDFDPNLKNGYSKVSPLEPDLIEAINKIKNADHIVWIFPVWWYSYPAIMKGFIDRVFLPGVTYQMIEGKSLPQKLLKGISARLIITGDTPKWYDILFMKRPVINQFKKGTLQFCGIGPVHVSYITPIKNSDLAFRKKWLIKSI